jgi:Ca2+-binding RTX toxin-like protein
VFSSFVFAQKSNQISNTKKYKNPAQLAFGTYYSNIPVLNQRIYGSVRSNFFMASSGCDYYDGRGENDSDTVAYYFALNGINVDLSKDIAADNGFGCKDNLLNIENVMGTYFDDIFIGDHKSNFFMGYNGNDYVEGKEGVDHLYGDEGEDILDGGDGDDILYGGEGNDIFFGGAGKDTAYFIGEISSYSISYKDNVHIIKDNIGDEGVDTLDSVELIKFSQDQYLYINCFLP